MSEAKIEFWYDGEIIEKLSRNYVPSKDDLIHLVGKLYKVEVVCWEFTEGKSVPDKVQITLQMDTEYS